VEHLNKDEGSVYERGTGRGRVVMKKELILTLTSSTLLG
jgi:hypothetical protein